jgi:hypothetical protein
MKRLIALMRCWLRSHCCCTDLMGTKRIFGRPTASQIASASLPSFLPLLRQGVTNFGHQLHRMTGGAETARPFMGARACLRADQAGRQSCHELTELGPRDRTPHRHHSLRVDAVQGEGILCQVNSKRRNCIHGRYATFSRAKARVGTNAGIILSAVVQRPCSTTGRGGAK